SDGWYGKTIGPIEHRDLFIFRAIETRRYLLRSARTGISCIIDPYGRIIEERGLFKKGIIKGIIKVPERDYKTIYVKYGEITGRISLFILIVSIILALIL
ncbi:MAG: nitrilase-related carbon-nitrogen hydrolase, partial [candidate division WOR-3 bacterium]